MENKTDAPIALLDRFQSSKEGIQKFVMSIVEEVREGRIDPLKVKVFCKTLEEISKAIDGDTKTFQKSEAEKHGDKPFMLFGAELHLTSVKTEYDYSVCGDPVLNRLLLKETDITEEVKARKELLKALKKPQEMFDPETSEVSLVKPPAKLQTEGVKVSIKKQSNEN